MQFPVHTGKFGYEVIRLVGRLTNTNCRSVLYGGGNRCHCRPMMFRSGQMSAVAQLCQHYCEQDGYATSGEQWMGEG
jgi:hypothetical protein